MRGGEPVQMFTAIGRVKDAEPYTVDMGGGFAPMRRDVEFLDAHPASVRPLIEQLAFMKDKRNWAYPFRFGVLSISEDDFRLIAGAMGVSLLQ